MCCYTYPTCTVKLFTRLSGAVKHFSPAKDLASHPLQILCDNQQYLMKSRRSKTLKFLFIYLFNKTLLLTIHRNLKKVHSKL